jgi:fructose-1-phosphate kinase PfkB-like protein
MKYDVLAINANPLLNLVYPGDFQQWAINRVSAMAMAAEGKGVNVARVLANHGHRVILTGFAGGWSGALLRELVRGKGIADALIETEAPLRVGFMASGAENSHPTTVFPGGFSVTAGECRFLLDRVEQLVGSVRLVIASGSTPDPGANHIYADLLSLCDAHGVPCWLDAYGAAMSLALAGEAPPRLATPNRQEFEQGGAWNRVEELHITDGNRPFKVTSREEGNWRVTPPNVRQINPVGSGDCYVAGLAHGWLRDWPLERRLKYGVAAGAVNAGRQDVATFSPAEVEGLLDQVRVERLDG